MADEVVQEEETNVAPATETTQEGAESPNQEPVVETTEETTEPTQEAPEGEETPTEEAPSEETTEEESTVEYEEYDHPALKQVVNILQEANISVEESNAIFAEAVESGDLSKIDKASLVDKLGQDKADMVLVMAESYYNTQFQQFKGIKDSAYELTGGQENFEAMQQWVAAKEKTDPQFAKEIADYRAMVDSGNPKAVNAAVKDVFEMYRKDPNTTIAAKNLTQGDGKVTHDGSALSRAEYAKEVEKARRNGTYDKVHTGLWQRRQAGMKQGL